MIRSDGAVVCILYKYKPYPQENCPLLLQSIFWICSFCNASLHDSVQVVHCIMPPLISWSNKEYLTHSLYEIKSWWGRELVALLGLSSWCLVMVERLFLVLPRGCLRFVIVVFPDHNHLLFLVTTALSISVQYRVGRTSLFSSYCLKVNASMPESCHTFH